MSEYKTTLQRREDALLDHVNDYRDELDDILRVCAVWASIGPEHVGFADEVRHVIRDYEEKRNNEGH